MSTRTRATEDAHRGIGDLRTRYMRLEHDREQFLRRARDAARITIPALLPENTETRNDDLPEPYQSTGARGVNNLASKLLLALFPINAKFFRLKIDVGELDEDIQDQLTEIEEALAEVEDQVLDEFEASALRLKLYEVLRLIVATGNCLLHMPANRAPRFFRLDSYVVERDPRGNVLQIITRQKVSPAVLPFDFRIKIGRVDGHDTTDKSGFVEVFTGIVRMVIAGQTMWREWQEVNGHRLGGVIIHKEKRNPYIALRMNVVEGESYGRGHVEEFMGALRSLEGLSQALHDGALAASKVIPLVDPDGLTRIKTLEKARNGKFVPGRKDDVTFLQVDKFADFRVVAEEIAGLKRELGFVFLLNSTATRDAERVTAEEIRFIAQELEDTLGGAYSLMSADLQMPMVDVLMGRLQDEAKLEELPSFIRPVIVTGLAAIGRGHDLLRLDQFVAGALEKFGPAVLQFINMPVYLQQRATALGINVKELIKSPEVVAAEQQAAQLARAAEKLGPAVIKQFPDETKEAVQQITDTGAVPNLQLVQQSA